MIRQFLTNDLPRLAEGSSGGDTQELIATVRQFAEKLQNQRLMDEARIKRMELSVETAINGLSDGVVVLSPAGNVEAANQVAQKLFGIIPDESVETLGLPWFSELMEQAKISSSDIFVYNKMLQIFDERMERFFLPKLTVLRRDNEIQGFTLVLTDTTMVRQIEEAKSSLIATVSHELKTPLTSIQMAIHLLLDGVLGSLNVKQTELMMAARDDTTRLHQLIERLLDVGRLHARAELMFREYSPHLLMNQALEKLQGGPVVKNLTQPDLPMILADSDQIETAVGAVMQAAALLNHCDEAEIKASTHRSYVNFSIILKEDFPADNYDAFFSRVALAKEIIATHGGVFEVQQEHGVPLTVRFTLRRPGESAGGSGSSDLERNQTVCNELHDFGRVHV